MIHYGIFCSRLIGVKQFDRSTIIYNGEASGKVGLLQKKGRQNYGEERSQN